MKTEFTFEDRWNAAALPGSEHTEHALSHLLHANPIRGDVLHCAIPINRARTFTQFALPHGVTASDCLTAAATGRFPEALRDWRYATKLQADRQLPQMRTLPPAHARLSHLPWFDSPSQSLHLGLNARHLRYHHQLWHELRPQVLQGVHTTLVLVLPQTGFALTPHINLERAFLYLGSLARGLAPVQLFPARFLFPDANLGQLAEAPAPIFADLLPLTGGFAYPVMDCEPDPWRVLARFGQLNRYLGYPFTRTHALEDTTLTHWETGAMLLPEGERVTARHSATHAHATLDRQLHRELLLSRDAFEVVTGLHRGTITHDGLPFQLPVELQNMVYAIMLTHWRLELDRPGDLRSYVVFTDHAAVRGWHYFQRVEPYYSQFRKLIRSLAKQRDFCTYPLSTHLTHDWLGGNLRLSNQLSKSEAALGPELMRSYYHQQLDWMAGVCNLMNHVAFRRQPGTKRSRAALEMQNEFSRDALAFHQMQRSLLRFDSHLFPRPTRHSSIWPQLHPGFKDLDRKFLTETLPKL